MGAEFIEKKALFDIIIKICARTSTLYVCTNVMCVSSERTVLEYPRTKMTLDQKISLE